MRCINLHEYRHSDQKAYFQLESPMSHHAKSVMKEHSSQKTYRGLSRSTAAPSFSPNGHRLVSRIVDVKWPHRTTKVRWRPRESSSVVRNPLNQDGLTHMYSGLAHLDVFINSCQPLNAQSWFPNCQGLVYWRYSMQTVQTSLTRVNAAPARMLKQVAEQPLTPWGKTLGVTTPVS